MAVERMCKAMNCDREPYKNRSTCGHHRWMLSRYDSFTRPPDVKPFRRVTKSEVNEWTMLYMSGLNSKQIGERFDRHFSVVIYHLKQANVMRSKSEVKIGELNPMWVGLYVGNQALHAWVSRHKPKPDFCERCKDAAPYDLANISQKYLRDVNDYKWLCRKCHMLSDGRMSNLKQYQGTENVPRSSPL